MFDNMLNGFWCWVVELLPDSMAPNLVTLWGLVVLGSASLSMIYYDVSMTKELPSWTYLFSAIGVFIFQTMDAIDGKQARRTNSSSPLGQLFDHGWDALAWTFVNINLVSVFRVGLSTSVVSGWEILKINI